MHSVLGDFSDRDGLNRAGGSPDVRSGLSGLLTYFRPDPVLRMPLHIAASVQRVGIAGSTIAGSTKVNRIGRRTAYAMLVILVLAIVWQALGSL